MLAVQVPTQQPSHQAWHTYAHPKRYSDTRQEHKQASLSTVQAVPEYIARDHARHLAKYHTAKMGLGHLQRSPCCCVCFYCQCSLATGDIIQAQTHAIQWPWDGDRIQQGQMQGRSLAHGHRGTTASLVAAFSSSALLRAAAITSASASSPKSFSCITLHRTTMNHLQYAICCQAACCAMEGMLA